MTGVLLYIIFGAVVICVGCSVMSWITYRLARACQEQCHGMETNIFRERLRALGLREETLDAFAPKDES